MPPAQEPSTGLSERPLLFSLIMSAQSGWGGCRPSPRKLTEATRMTEYVNRSPASAGGRSNDVREDLPPQDVPCPFTSGDSSLHIAAHSLFEGRGSDHASNRRGLDYGDAEDQCRFTGFRLLSRGSA